MSEREKRTRQRQNEDKEGREGGRWERVEGVREKGVEREREKEKEKEKERKKETEKKGVCAQILSIVSPRLILPKKRMGRTYV